jgi:cellobiose-specific phosphotransferase system component IIA
LRPAHQHDTDFLNASARIAASRRSLVLVHGQSLPLIWLSNN